MYCTFKYRLMCKLHGFVDLSMKYNYCILQTVENKTSRNSVTWGTIIRETAIMKMFQDVNLLNWPNNSVCYTAMNLGFNNGRKNFNVRRTTLRVVDENEIEPAETKSFLLVKECRRQD
jgi:hypothetical protein